MPGLIERYRDELPFDEGDPLVSLGEGGTPLVLAPRLSERVGAEVWLKLEGTNPTGSFKDRGMTCAGSAAGVAGVLVHGARDAQRIVCVLTGHGLKDPDTALAQAGSVIPCEVEIGAIERAVLG